MMTTGEKIKKLRRQKGLSQEELGFAINVTRQTISKWEADTMQPSTDNIVELCNQFDVDPNFFLNDDGASCDEQSNVSANAVATTAPRPHFSKKIIVLFSLLATLCAMVLTLCILIGCIAINIDNQPSLGYSEVQVLQVNWVSIICFIVAGCSLVCMLTLIILLIVRRKRKM